jgi:hypothetical protein
LIYICIHTHTHAHICIYTYTHTILDGNRHRRISCKTIASPVFAFLHTKQITVIICIEEVVEEENYDSKFEQVSVIVCFTAVTGSETESLSLKASLCDYLSKQRSDVKYGEIETYVDKWDIECKV